MKKSINSFMSKAANTLQMNFEFIVSNHFTGQSNMDWFYKWNPKDRKEVIASHRAYLRVTNEAITSNKKTFEILNSFERTKGVEQDLAYLALKIKDLEAEVIEIQKRINHLLSIEAKSKYK